MRFTLLVALIAAGCSNRLDAIDTDPDSGSDPDTSDPDTSDTDTDPGTEDPDTEDPDTEPDTDPDTSGGFTPGSALNTLRNHPTAYPAPCTPSAYESIQGDYGWENNHWIASRLTPASYPFEVDAIQIELWHAPSEEGKCRATTARPVQVFTGTGIEPPERPSQAPKLQTYSMMPALETNGWFIRKELDSPITLVEGEHLFVTMQMEAVFEGSTCIRSCRDAPLDDRNYWSNSHMEPFTNWEDILEPRINLRQNYLIEAYDLP